MQRPLALYARWKKQHFFSKFCKKTDTILDVGAGEGWWERYLRKQGYTFVTSIDLDCPFGISGNVQEWQTLGLQPESFDVITAFEVVEHEPCIPALHALLKPNGLLILTTPVPSRDWLLHILEACGLSQLRTSPHSHLRDISTIEGFHTMVYRRIAGLAQWGVFQKKA